MMLRVRPAQLTTTSVSAGALSGKRKRVRRPAFHAGRDHDAGIFVERPRSSTTMSVPECIARELFGRDDRRPVLVLTYSPNALLGTLTPENSRIRPAPRRIAVVEDATSVAGLPQLLRGAFGEAVAVVHEHDPCPRARHQAREALLDPAQRHRRANSRWLSEKMRSSRTSTSASSAPSRSISRSAAAPTLTASVASGRLLRRHLVHFAGFQVEAHPLDLVEVGPGHADEARAVGIVDRVVAPSW